MGKPNHQRDFCVPLEVFYQLWQMHKDNLSALMVTYPSTQALFEENIRRFVKQCMPTVGRPTWLV